MSRSGESLSWDFGGSSQRRCDSGLSPREGQINMPPGPTVRGLRENLVSEQKKLLFIRKASDFSLALLLRQLTVCAHPVSWPLEGVQDCLSHKQGGRQPRKPFWPSQGIFSLQEQSTLRHGLKP